MKQSVTLFILFFCFSASQSLAQFEGKIHFDSYIIKSKKKKEKNGDFTLYITPDRLLLQSGENYKVGGTLKTHGVLIRNKKEDFVFLTGNKKAMEITKAGITSFMNMFGSAQSNQSKPKINYKKTGKTKKINGYKCEKYIFSSAKHPDEHSVMWMTKGLNVNWGILADTWDQNMKAFAGDHLPADLIFKKGYFPIKWKQYKNDTPLKMIEAHVKATDVPHSKVSIPSDVQVTSLQQYLFQQMRKQH
jgi:GLPGLI family protein